MRDTRGFAIGEVLLATLIWSGSFVLIKWGLESWRPLTFVAVRYSLGGLLLALGATVCFGASQILVRELAYEVGVLANVMPLEVAVLAWLLLGEALGPAQWAAMAIVVLGIAVVQVAARLTALMGGAPVAALSWVR